MGYRLSKIYTRTGDDGTTGVGDGARVDKDCCQIKVIGAIDELNAVLGCVLAEKADTECDAVLLAIQHQLFDIGGELAYPEYKGVDSDTVLWLERWIDHFNQSLEPLQDFILPNGNRAVACTHLARTVCRRAERHMVSWSREHQIRDELIHYMNRLSDLLFVMSRMQQQRGNCPSAQWNKHTKLPQPGE